MNRPVARGVLIREEHIETLKRLPNKTMDAVLGAAFRVAIGEIGALAVKDQTGILDAVVQSIAIAALKFDENEKERRARDAERKRRKANQGQIHHEKGERDRLEGERDRLEGDENRLGGDKRGIRPKERRKEGKNIYTPISPKGNLRLPPEVDVDGILGKVAAAAGEEEEPTGKEAAAEPNEEVTVAEVAARMEARHPNPAGTDSFPKSLVRYLKKNSGAPKPEGGGEEGWEHMLGEIEASHRRWIESGVWDAEEGRYAPQLKNWLWGGDWKKEPPEKKRARPAEDADDFHAGASL